MTVRFSLSLSLSLSLPVYDRMPLSLSLSLSHTLSLTHTLFLSLADCWWMSQPLLRLSRWFPRSEDIRVCVVAVADPLSNGQICSYLIAAVDSLPGATV